MNGRHSKLLYDLPFTTGGVKTWISKYIIDHYKCPKMGYLLDSGSPYILWSDSSGFAKHFTMDL